MDAFAGMSYTDILAVLQRRLDEDAKSGGDRALMAQTMSEQLAEHQPTEPRVGAPCRACGMPWPCEVPYLIAAPE
jgi:hypothetical protein